MKHPIDLIIPGLCGPLADISGFNESQMLSGFVSTLAKANKISAIVNQYPEQLCSVLGLKTDSIPMALLSLSAYGIDKQDYYWMHADPVHMMADVDHLVLYESNSLMLDLNDATILLADLNKHFQQDGIEFVLGDANHWFIKSKKPFNVTTTRLNDTVMQNVNPLMPVGDDAVFVKQLLNESQMLMHANEVNVKREENGLLTVNSLWIWGEGELLEKTDLNDTVLIGNDILLKGISNYFAIKHVEVTTAEPLIDAIKTSNKCVIVFDDLITACSYGDTQSWLSSFESLYEYLLEPVIKYASDCHLKINYYPCNGYQYIFDSKMKYRFWRKGNMKNYFEYNH